MMAAEDRGQKGEVKTGPRSAGFGVKAIGSLRQPWKAPPEIMTLRVDISSSARRSPIWSRWPGPKRRRFCAAARALRYREHIGVNLLIEGRPFPDNWIYVHSPEVASRAHCQLPQFLAGHGGADDLVRSLLNISPSVAMNVRRHPTKR